MRKSFVFLAFFCAIVVIDGNFIHDAFRRGTDLGTTLLRPVWRNPGFHGAHLQQANQQGQAQGQATGQPGQQAQGQQGQGGQGQQQGQQDQQGMQAQGQQEPIDCLKFNTDSQLSSDKACLPTTTVLRNSTHWAFCDNALASQSQQQSPIQGGATGAEGDVERPLVACKIDEQGVLTCLPKDQAQSLGSSTQGGSSPIGAQISPGTSQAQVSSTEGTQADIIGKTFTSCFLYVQSELVEQSLDEEEQIQYMCVRRKPKKPTTGIAGQQAQQGQPPSQQPPSQQPPSQQPPPQQPPSQNQQQSQSGGENQRQSQQQSQDSKKP